MALNEASYPCRPSPAFSMTEQMVSGAECVHKSVEQEGEEAELDQAKRRLRKALALAEKFKDKYLLELKVSSELARRCDDLKTQSKLDRSLIGEMEREISLLRELSCKSSESATTAAMSDTTAAIPAAISVDTQKRFPVFSGESFDSLTLAPASVTVGAPKRFGHSLDSFDDDESMGQSVINRTVSMSVLSEDPGLVVAAAAVSLASVPTAVRVQEAPLKLFEYFLVVGASTEAAINLASHSPEESQTPFVDLNGDQRASTKMNLIRRIGGIMSASPFSSLSPKQPSASERVTRRTSDADSAKGALSPKIPRTARRLVQSGSTTPRDEPQGIYGMVQPVACNVAPGAAPKMRRHSISTAAPLPVSTSAAAAAAAAAAARRTSFPYPLPLVVTPHGRGPERAEVTHTTADLLYRYPDAAATTASVSPSDVTDFCLPLGGLLSLLPPSRSLSPCRDDNGASNTGGLSPNGSVRRLPDPYSNDTSGCFAFVLDDKTVRRKDKKTRDGDATPMEGSVASPGKRLYGICVQQTRRLSVPLGRDGSPSSAHIAPPTGPTHGIYRAFSDGTNDSTSAVYESRVCFAIVTRFPLFDFFFEVIRQVIQCEGSAAEGHVPARVLEEALGRLIKLPPPAYGANLSFQVGSDPNMTVRTCRYSPPGGEEGKSKEGSQLLADCEHRSMSAKWSLSVLLSPHALSVELLVRTLGLLLCEAKVVIVGSDLRLVSAAVMGLQCLLSPLEWVAPAISILPHKLLEFLECPVPLMAGLEVVFLPPQSVYPPLPNPLVAPAPPAYFSPREMKESDSRGGERGEGEYRRLAGTLRPASLRAAKLLHRCGDGMDALGCSEEGMLSAVLDIDEKELFLCGRYSSEGSREQLVMPGAQKLVDRIKACLSEVCPSSSPQGSFFDGKHTDQEGGQEGKTLRCFDGDRGRGESEADLGLLCKVQGVIEDHIRWVLSLCVPSSFEERDLASCDEESPSPPRTRIAAPSTGKQHASTFDEVMSLALIDPQGDEEEGEGDERVRSVYSSKDDQEGGTNRPRTRGMGPTSTKMAQRVSVSLKRPPREQDAVIAVSRTISATSTNTLVSTNSVNTDSRRNSDYGALTPRTASLNLRSNLRRMLNRPRGRESRVSEQDDLERGGMSVLLMSQEGALKGNQKAFLRRFTATQMYAESVPVVAPCVEEKKEREKEELKEEVKEEVKEKVVDRSPLSVAVEVPIAAAKQGSGDGSWSPPRPPIPPLPLPAPFMKAAAVRHLDMTSEGSDYAPKMSRTRRSSPGYASSKMYYSDSSDDGGQWSNSNRFNGNDSD